MSAQAGSMSSSAMRVASRLWWPSRRANSVTSMVRDIGHGSWSGAETLLRSVANHMVWPDAPSVRSRRQPLLDVRPGVFLRPAAGHDADVPAAHAEHFLVLAAEQRHDALRLARRR